MAIVKRSVIDKIEIMTEPGNIHFRIATWFEEDGVVIGDRTFHRETRTPLDDCSGDEQCIQDQATLVHTTEKKAQAQAVIDARIAEEAAHQKLLADAEADRLLLLEEEAAH